MPEISEKNYMPEISERNFMPNISERTVMPDIREPNNAERDFQRIRDKITDRRSIYAG